MSHGDIKNQHKFSYSENQKGKPSKKPEKKNINQFDNSCVMHNILFTPNPFYLINRNIQLQTPQF